MYSSYSSSSSSSTYKSLATGPSDYIHPWGVHIGQDLDRVASATSSRSLGIGTYTHAQGRRAVGVTSP
eukprot:6093706-Pyramimonas_sp.AAC.1